MKIVFRQLNIHFHNVPNINITPSSLNIMYTDVWGLPWWLRGKESTCNEGDWVQSLGWEDPLEKGKATHSSILAWRIYSPWGHKESDITE